MKKTCFGAKENFTECTLFTEYISSTKYISTLPSKYISSIKSILSTNCTPPIVIILDETCSK